MAASFFGAKSSSSSSSSSAATGAPHERVVALPWVEKYRPKQMDDIAHQEQVVRVLKKTLESKNLPHLLFYGPPGTGKTSTVLALARELFGPELIKKRVLELNASDERGINVIREKVKNFSQSAVSTEVVGGYPCPPFKIIILDEADSLTKDAQSALRRIMEAYSKSTRFCIICNYISRIIEPLASRCAKFRFMPLDDASAKARLEMICGAETVNHGPGALDELLKVSDGDLRKAIMYLQNAKRVFGMKELTPDVFIDMSGVIPDSVVKLLLDTCEQKAFEQVEQVVKDIIVEGYSVVQLIHQILDKLTQDAVFNERQQALVSQRLGKIDKALVDGADEHLQLLDLATYMMQVFQRSK